MKDFGQDQFFLTIPTYRINEAIETARRYVLSFNSFNHNIPIIIFNDRNGEPLKESFLSLEKLNYPAGIYYVGLSEKKQIINELQEKLGEKELIEEIFKPSYGGNRNFTIIYTYRSRFITVDDDIYPYSIRSVSTSLEGNQIASGNFVNMGSDEIYLKPENIVSEFRKYLGTKVSDHSCQKGEYLEDDAMDLFTNNSKGGFSNNKLILVGNKIPEDALIAHCQTYRTGSPDIDTKDYIEEFLLNPYLITVNDLPRVYALSACKPCITSCNWRVDSAVSAFDNRQGLPPFIPTSLRYEDYIFRLWLTWNKVASANVAAIQTHKRSSTNRPSLADDFINEELTKIMKNGLRSAINKITQVSIDFKPIDFSDSEILQSFNEAKIMSEKLAEKMSSNKSDPHYFQDFSLALYNNFSGFDDKVFLLKTRNRLVREFLLLQKTLKIWPKIIETLPSINLKFRRIL